MSTVIFLQLLLSACNFTTRYDYDASLYGSEPFSSYQDYVEQNCRVDFDGLARLLHHSVGSGQSRDSLERTILHKRREIFELAWMGGGRQTCFFEAIATSSIPFYFGPYVDISTYYELWIRPDADGAGGPLLCLGVNPLSPLTSAELKVGPPADPAFPRGNPMPETYRRGPAERERYLPICMTGQGDRHGHLEEPSL